MFPSHDRAGVATPAGSDTQVQFNDGGSTGADSAFIYNKTNDALAVEHLVVGNTTDITPKNTVEIRTTGGDTDNGILLVRDDTVTTDNDILGGIGFDSTDGNVPSSILEASAYIAGFAGQNHSTTEKEGYLTFGMSKINDDDDTTSIEAVRIHVNSNGKPVVGIGKTNGSRALDVLSDSFNSYVARIENEGDESTVRCLRLKIGVTGNPGANNLWAEFVKASGGSLGSIGGLDRDWET